MRGWKVVNLNNLRVRRASLRKWCKDSRESLGTLSTERVWRKTPRQRWRTSQRCWVRKEPSMFQNEHEAKVTDRKEQRKTHSQTLRSEAHAVVRSVCGENTSFRDCVFHAFILSCDRNSREKFQACSCAVFTVDLALSGVTWKDNWNKKLPRSC